MTLRFDQFTYLHMENDDLPLLPEIEPFNHKDDDFDEIEMYHPVWNGKKIITKFEDFQSYLHSIGNPTAK